MADGDNVQVQERVTPESLVTENHIRKALKADKGENAILQSWAIRDFTMKGDNYVCVVKRVETKYSLHGCNEEETYIVKVNGCRKMESTDDLWHVLFTKELKFYTTVIPAMNSILEKVGCERLRAPRCFYGSLETGREILFLEDLHPRNFKMFDRKKGMDIAHLELVLLELAKLHAASVLIEEDFGSSKRNFLQIYPFLEKDIFSYRDGDCEEVLSLYKQFLSNSILVLENATGYEKAITWVKSLRMQLNDIFGKNKLSKRCNVACHGDIWNNNILFRYDGEGHPVEVMLLDFQLCRYASPATDLNYLLYSSAEGHIRKPNLNALLSIYHDAFRKTVEAGGRNVPFTEEECKEEFREQYRFGAVSAMVLIPIVLMETDDVPDLANMTKVSELGDSVASSIKKMMEGSSLVKPRFLSAFDEFKEMGVFG